MNLLHYCFCFVFWPWGMWGLSALAGRGNNPASPALEGETLTTGPPEKSLDFFFKARVFPVCSEFRLKVAPQINSLNGWSSNFKPRFGEMSLYFCRSRSTWWTELEHREWCCFPIMPPLNPVAWGCGLLWFFYLLLKPTSIWISCNENGLKFSFPLFFCGNLTLCNCYLFLEGKLYWPPLGNNFFPSSMLFW